MNPPARPVLDDVALGWVHRGVWANTIGVYLTVFIGGITSGGADIPVLARAIAFTLGTGLLGRIGVGVLSRASLPVLEGPLAMQDGPVGSLIDLESSTNVAPHDDEAEAA